MSKRNLFEELSTALVEAKQHSEGKLTLDSLTAHTHWTDGQVSLHLGIAA